MSRGYTLQLYRRVLYQVHDHQQIDHGLAFLRNRVCFLQVIKKWLGISVTRDFKLGVDPLHLPRLFLPSACFPSVDDTVYFELGTDGSFLHTASCDRQESSMTSLLSVNERCVTHNLSPHQMIFTYVPSTPVSHSMRIQVPAQSCSRSVRTEARHDPEANLGIPLPCHRPDTANF